MAPYKGAKYRGGFVGGGYRSAASVSPPSNSGGHHGLLGFAENLGSDVVHSIEGIPTGIVQTVEHPVRTVKQIGKSYAETYGPLVHGDVSGFLHNLYNHPLGPALDAATVLSLGAAGLERAGLAPEIARSIVHRSPGEILGRADASTGLEVPITGGPAQRAIKIAAHHARQKLSTMHESLGHSGISETAKFGQELKYLPTQTYRAAKALQRNYVKAFGKLKPEEQTALHLIGNNVHPLDYGDYLKTQGSVEPVMLKVLEHPEVIHHFENPSPKLLHAVSEAQKLSRIDAAAKIARGTLDEDTALNRLDFHRNLVKDALGEENLRPTPDTPFYVPDREPYDKKAPLSSYMPKSSGGVPRLTSGMKHNEGVLFRTGRIALNGNLLSNEYLQTIGYGLKDDLHDALEAHAVRMDRNQIETAGLPRGWVFVPKKLLNKSGLPKPQQISHTLKTSGTTKRGLAELLPDDVDESTFISRNPEDAMRLHGDYLAVPERLVRSLVGEYKRSSSLVENFVHKPTRVWRALVLGGRIGFLTNNVVGNHLLFAIHAAGPDGLRAYLNSVRRAHGAGMVKTLLNERYVPPAMRQEFMDEFFPEQGSEAAFGSTQMPVEGSIAHKLDQSAVGRVARKIATGVAPATQAVAETNLRRALVETYLRKSPEFKAVYDAMPKQTRDFEAAARQILNGKGGKLLQRRVSMQVDHALGNYLNLGPLATAMRGAIPFIAWYRAILSITGHLALDTPGRADILAKLGQIGTTSAQQELAKLYGGAENVPSWLLGEIVTDHKGGVISTTGLNPFQTVNQIGSAVVPLIAGKPAAAGQAISNLGLNPILQTALNYGAGKDLFTGKTLNTRGGLVGSVLAQNIEQLPQTSLAKAVLGHGNVTKTYGKQSAAGAIEQYAGLPIKRLAVGR